MTVSQPSISISLAHLFKPRNPLPMVQKKIKTRFPAARIKRIMRLDEEIGKVSQVTPFLVAKSLELFLKSMIDQTLEITIAKSAKKMTNTHIKEMIESVEKFDFLKDLVAGLPAVVEEVVKTPKKRKTKAQKEEEAAAALKNDL
jgi:hypothetical protein